MVVRVVTSQDAHLLLVLFLLSPDFRGIDFFNLRKDTGVRLLLQIQPAIKIASAWVELGE